VSVIPASLAVLLARQGDETPLQEIAKPQKIGDLNVPLLFVLKEIAWVLIPGICD
jgi:hypothetical protein